MAFPQLVYSSAPTLPKGLKPAYFSALDGTAEQAAEKVASGQEPRPQRLKPYSKQCSYRSAEALRHPKSRAKSSFSATCEAVPYPKPNRNLQIPVMPVYP
jgi:hypothetical protein